MKITLLLLLATFLWGVWGFAEKEAVNRSDPYTVQWMYGVPYVLAIPVWFWLSRQYGEVVQEAGSWKWAVGGSLAGILALLLLLVAMQERSASVAVGVTAAYPLVTLLLGWLAGQESLSIARLLGIGLIVAGVWVLQTAK